MSYSRWGKHSVWYTFWTSNFSEKMEYRFPTKRLKDNQFFEICDLESPVYISYKLLKQIGIKGALKHVQMTYKDRDYIKFSDYTKLRWYLIQFMSDVDEHFEWQNFFRYEWYYPIRNQIIWKIYPIKNRIYWVWKSFINRIK